jgi:thiamine pyrophosphokinase
MYYYTPKKLLIVGGADFSEDLFKEVYDNEIPIIAADGGANFLTEKNISPELVIGDLDSVSEQQIQNIEPEKIIRISEQDSTDLEKVLCNTQSPLTIGIGFLGSQIDHELAALSALAKFPEKKIILIGEHDIIFLVPPSFSLRSFNGMRISLYPLDEVKVHSDGLQWATDGLTMKPTGQIGTSNKAIGKSIYLAPDKPKLLLILPKTVLNEAVSQLELAQSW